MKGFTFWKSYYDVLKKLTVEQRGEFITKMGEFAFEEKEPTFSEDEEKMEIAWLGIVANLVTSKKKSTVKSSEKSPKKSQK